MDILLPKTDTPSASEVNVHLFIDRFADQVMEREQQDFMKMAMGKFVDKALKDSDKELAGNLAPEDLEPVLASALKVTKEQEKLNHETIGVYREALGKGETAKITDELARFAFADNLRGLTIWGYKTSEYVGEEVLAYLSIPGGYVGCMDVEELTGGKAWSL